MRPRIVIVSAFYSPVRSGAEACAEEVAERLSVAYDITVLTTRIRPDLPAEEVRNGVHIRRLGRGSRFDKWWFPWRAWREIHRDPPHIVHAILESYAGAVLILMHWLGPARSRRVLTCQSTNTRLLVRAMHRAAHRVTVISRVLTERADGYGVLSERIPNGVDATSIGAVPRSASGRQVLYVGRLEPMKGVDTLIQAFASIVDLGATLTIVGDGSCRAALQEQVCQAGLTERVVFVGYVPVPDVYAYYRRADVFCGLSRSEALGNVFLEAQAAGCAVVATRVGGIVDVVLDGQTGLLVPPDDARAAALALRQCLQDPALRERLAQNGIVHAQAYDWRQIAARYDQVYRATRA